MRSLLIAITVISASTSAMAQSPAEVGVSPLAQNYGFLPVEVTKLSPRMSSLQAADLNDDGFTDLLIINNDRNRLDLLIQRKSPPQNEALRAVAVQDVNRLENPWRFDPQKISVEQEVVAATVGDFDNDGRTDIAYFGNPDRLIVRFQTDDGQWAKRWQIRLSEVAAAAWCLGAGDLNGDGRTDLVLLGKNDTFLLLQPESGDMGQPVRLMNTSDQLSMVQVADVNDDGLDDLCYLAGDAVNRRLGMRLQTLDGQMGPEYLFDLERPRAVTVRDVDGDGSSEILTIDSRTGRLKVLKVRLADLEGDALPDRLVRYGFGKRGSGRDRDLAISDVDGDGKLDVVVSDPDAARLLLFRQQADRGLDLGTAYPSLSGGGTLRAGIVSGSPVPRLFLHSSLEKSVAETHWDGQRLTFPHALPTEFEPNGIEFLPANRHQQPELLIFSRDKEGRNSTFSLTTFRQSADHSQWVPSHHTINEMENGSVKTAVPSENASGAIAITGLKSVPEGSLLLDLTGDQFPECVIFQGAKPPVVLTNTEGGQWSELPTSGTLGAGNISMSALFARRDRQPNSLFVAQENFLRELRLGPEGRWDVADQVNVGESQGKIVGSALLDLDNRPGDELVLVDAGVKKLRIQKLVEQRYQPWKEIELGDFSLKSTKVADLNGDSRPDLLLFGEDQFVVLYAGGTTPALEEVAGYESSIEQRFPADALAGDLNGDGQANLVLIDTRNRQVEILEYRPPAQLERALYFTVFDEKGFAREEAIGGEPREGIVADVTGDGRADLVLLVHDRILVYPQDAGSVGR